MLKLTPRDLKREDNSKMVKDLLTSRYLTFSIDRLVVHEDIINDSTRVECSLCVVDGKGNNVEYFIEGLGFGFLDALFNGVTEKLAKDCSTLNNISVQGFQARVDEKDLREQKESLRGSDASVEICLTIDNGFDNINKFIPFRSKSRSMLSASVGVVIETIQYFVNSQNAVVYLKELILDSERRNRFDLTEYYISKLSSLMSNTSYEDI